MNFRILFALLLLPLSLSVTHAANPNSTGGTWTNVMVVGVTACIAARCPPKGWIVVEVSADAAGSPPTCARDNPRSVAIDMESPAGAFAASILQAAALTGMPITIAGTGTCGVDAAIESLAKVTETSRNSSALR